MIKNTKVDIDEWLNDSWEIIVDLHVARDNWHRIAYQSKYEGEDFLKVNKGFFQYSISTYRFMIFIQLSKLWGSGKHQTITFSRIIEVIKNSRELRDKNHIDIIAKAEKLIKSNYEIASKVDTQRNEVYAHTIPSPKVVPISFLELSELIATTEEVYKLIASLFDAKCFIFPTQSWNIDDVFHICETHFIVHRKMEEE
jgi:AbiU2